MRRHTLAPAALSLAALLLPIARVASAAPVSPEHMQSQPVSILELFTSEGCSSCPPADALLRAVNGTQASGGQRIVGISEHVTYWNRLGWTDPFSDEAFTNRQTTYAHRLSPEGSYTPQMVLNGRAQFVGSDAAALRQALQDDAHGDRQSIRPGCGPHGRCRPVECPARGELRSRSGACLGRARADPGCVRAG